MTALALTDELVRSGERHGVAETTDKHGCAIDKMVTDRFCERNQL